MKDGKLLVHGMLQLRWISRVLQYISLFTKWSNYTRRDFGIHLAAGRLDESAYEKMSEEAHGFTRVGTEADPVTVAAEAILG